MRDKEGSVVVWFAGGMTMLLGLGALAVDVGHFFSLRSEMQNAADATAMAAVSKLPSKVDVETLALSITDENLPPAVHGTVLAKSDIELGQWDRTTKVFTAGLNPPTAVRVTMRRTVASGNPAQTFFGRTLGYNNMDIVTQAIAAPPAAPSCVVSLEPNAQDAIMLNSSSTLTANGCAIQVNSASALAVGSTSSTVNAAEINLSGGYTGSGYNPAPTTGAKQLSDPLASLPVPPEATDPCDHTDLTYSSTTVTLSPGVYCKKLELNSLTDATLLPGTYVMRDGDFMVNSNSTVTGTGVFIYFTGNNTPELMLNSGSHADLSAPTTGPYAGILMYQDRNTADGSVFLLNSDASSHLLGTVYLPNGKIMINSGTTITGTAPYTSFIARTFEINSGSGIVLNSDYNGSTVPLPGGLAGSKTALVQ